MKKKLFLLLLILCSVFLVTGCNESSSDNSDKDETKEEKKETKKELSLTDAKVLKNYDLFKDYDGEFSSSTISEKSTTSTEIKKEDLLDRALRRVVATDRTFYDYNNQVTDNELMASYYIIPASTIEKYFNETYGGKIPFNKEDYKEFYFLIQTQSSPLRGEATVGSYDKEKDQFKMTVAGIGGNCGFDPCTLRKSKLISAYEKGKKLYLVEKQIFVLEKWDYFEFKGSEVYSDHEQKNLLEGNITDQKTNYDNYLERGSEVTIVLEKDDNDNYYFVESIVK